MSRYFYCWSLRTSSDMEIELKISAVSAIFARREVVQFLREHDGASWSVRSVTREVDSLPARPRIAIALPRSFEGHWT